MSKRTGHPRGDNSKRTTSIYVSKSTLNILDIKAYKRDMSRNELIADILDKAAYDTED